MALNSQKFETIATNLACTSNCGDGFIKCVQIEFLSANTRRKFEVRSKTTFTGYLGSSELGENLPNRLSLCTVGVYAAPLTLVRPEAVELVPANLPALPMEFVQ